MRAISSARTRYGTNPPPADPKGLGEWAMTELLQLSQYVQTVADGQLEQQHVAPEKLRDGMIRYADGTDWNPGSGEGLYAYYNSAWHPLGCAFPVGSIYTSINSTNPATSLGYGTWTAFGAGRVLVGYNSSDTDFDLDEETGGAKTKAISAHTGTAVANHASHTHTSASAPATPDLFTSNTAAAGVGMLTGNESATLTHTVTQPSAHTDLNVVQPYIVVRFWKRTA